MTLSDSRQGLFVRVCTRRQFVMDLPNKLRIMSMPDSVQCTFSTR